MRVAIPVCAAGSLGVVLWTLLWWGGHDRAEASTAELPGLQAVVEAYGRLPLAFEPNRGQASPEVLFLSSSPGANVSLTATAALFSLHARRGEAKAPSRGFKMMFVGANPSPEVTGAEALPGQVNYFRGNEPSRWLTSIPTYRQVRYRSVYEGVDLVFRGNPQQLEYDFELVPGADPGVIRLEFEGVEDLRLDDGGDLVLSVGGQEVRHRRPLVYQEFDGARREVQGAYVARSPTQVAFRLGSYDPSRAVVIDPLLVYSTYLGGSGAEYGNALAVDGAGNAYVTGETSSEFPNLNGFQVTSGGNYEAWVAKLNASGTALVYATHLGGDSGESGRAIAVDSSGNAYVTGTTSSTNFPLQGALQGGSGGGADAFVTKLSASGAALIYSTYLGGSGNDYGFGVAVDGAGLAVVVGDTYSGNFPTLSPLQPAFGGDTDGFVARVNATGSALLYASYLGGSVGDHSTGVTVDGSGNAYVVGYSFSSNFPTQGALQPALAGVFDAVVTRVNVDGGLGYSTFLGGSSADYGYGIAVDSTGSAYVVGTTQSVNFPTQGPFKATRGGASDAFVARLSAGGATLLFSTYLGGASDESGAAIAVDGTGNVYVTGSSRSADFPTLGPVQAVPSGSSDVVIVKLNPTGSALLFSTFLGGSDVDGASGIGLSGAGNVYVAGLTRSTSNFPMQSAVQPTAGSALNPDAFLAMFDTLSPHLRGVTPAFGSTAGGTAVTLDGFQFSAGATVTWAGSPLSAVFNTSDSLGAFTPPHAPGMVSVAASNPDGRSTTKSAAFLYVAPPVVTGIAAALGPSSGGTPVTVSGTDFVSGATLTLGGVAATGVVVVNATTLTATAPPHAPGTVNVVVTIPPGVSGTLAGAFTYEPPPSVSAVTPAVGYAAGGTTVTVTGANFVSSAVLTLGGVAATGVTVVNAGTLTATTGAHAPGAVTVVVQNPDGQSGSLAGGYTYEPAPSLSSVTPAFGSTLGGTPLAVSGANFVAGATVTVGGALATTVVVVDGGLLTAAAPPHAAGTVELEVTNPDGQTGRVDGGFLFVTPPTVAAVNPAVGPVTGGSVVQVSGADFVAGSTVTFGGAAATGVTVANAGLLTATTPAHLAGPASVVVTHPLGLQGQLDGGFTYLLPPTLTSVSPGSGGGQGGTAVTLTGTNFFTGAIVRFGGVLASNVVVAGPTTLGALTPVHAPGLVEVVVINPDGQSFLLSAAFTFTPPPPAVVSVTPFSGPTAGGTLLTINGSNFVAGASVWVGGLAASGVTVVSDLKITAVTPPNVAGTVEVAVRNPDSQSTALANAFAYFAPPGLGSITPTSGSVTGGTVVTLSGVDFRNGATVAFGALPAASTFLSATSMSATSPAHALGVVDLIVTNPDGQRSTLAQAFTYLPPAPSVSTIAPIAGTTLGGTEVTVSGANFNAATTVSFGGVAATSVRPVSDTVLSAKTPPHGAGLVAVEVANADGQSGSLASGFTFISPPSATGLSPSSGPTAGGTVVTLTGTDFDRSTVSFGVTPASVVSVTPTSVTVTSPQHAPGVFDVTVRNLDGQTSVLTQAFSYLAPPSPQSISPAAGPLVGGTAFTLSGTGFLPGAAVSLGGAPATALEVVDGATLTGVIPAHEVGRVDVVVLNPDGQAGTLALGFEYSSRSACVVDAECPEKERCFEGVCVARPVSRYALGCGATGGAGPGVAWLVLAGVALVARRRGREGRGRWTSRWPPRGERSADEVVGEQQAPSSS